MQDTTVTDLEKALKKAKQYVAEAAMMCRLRGDKNNTEYFENAEKEIRSALTRTDKEGT